jgi:hypothetical protein
MVILEQEQFEQALLLVNTPTKQAMQSEAQRTEAGVAFGDATAKAAYGEIMCYVQINELDEDGEFTAWGRVHDAIAQAIARQVGGGCGRLPQPAALSYPPAGGGWMPIWPKRTAR